MQYAKAIAALITPVVVTLLLPLGIDGDTTVSQAIELIVLGLVTAAAVYVTPNKPKV